MAAAEATTVHALVEQQAQRQPHAVYARATESQQHIAYGELARGCRRAASVLRGHGMQPGDTVSVVMPNGLQTLRLLLGAMHGGFVVNPVNLLSQPEQMRYVLAHSDCRVVCVAPEWESRVREMVEAFDRPVKLVVVDPEADALPGEEEMAAAASAPSPDAVALLMYTSGTTGMPKGVMLTQRNLAANAHAISAEHQLQPSDRVLAVLPLYHINAFAVTMLAPLAHGGSLAMPPKFSAGRFWEQATQTQCSWINVVPTMISYLLEGAKPPLAQTLAIRFCRSASAALPPEHHRAFEQMFGIGIVETMGLTETAAPSFSNPMDPAARKLGSVGRASGCMAGVIDAGLAAVANGVTGELVIRGPNVMLGYYKNEDATRASFTPDGWLRTGDLGHRDEDGFFFVTGRIKELIIKGGENIAPREIDEALLQHPAVLEAAAVGVPDRHYGQDIGVCIVLREGCTCTEDELREFSATALGRYKAPGHYRFVRDLPRGPSGKVQRLKLLPLFEA
ncbi:Acyl-CoA synthetase (AMP-forming)/AMP-acid ligase II [Variovorax sp. OK605]|uniref:AMP-binding protein n=1 Tax=Variovorax sp. OK605 TaxID=1855317 RepID=UPI0008EFCC9E|nr:AMP-binding protein [Variovorax sp. OK605]SFQ68347.1 Acyl-CoA synthetase (AMP-forming)/AMP-acid ligase II [Variovorax sp. OK605]